MQSITRPTLKADLALLLVTLLAASGWLFSKFAIGGMPPIGYIGIRYIAAALLLLPFAARQLFQLNKNQLFICVMVGLIQAGAMYLWIQAVDRSDRLGEGAFIMSLSMIMVPFMGRMVYGSRIDRYTLLALPIAIAGIALLALQGSWEFEPAQGLYLMATFFIALHFVYTNRNAPGIPSMALTFILLMVPGLVGMAISLSMESWPEQISTDTWVWVAAAVLIATSLRYFLYTWALKHSEAGHAALIMVIEPVWTAVMSAVWMGEIMTGQKLVGCGLIFLALIVARWRSIFKSFPYNR
ncbi:DMT family transporter [Endozoicomonas sp.]|uniref:DMT family transporter n=1 Tax=Endozoicomonas sp. TaxID=1892382 RepID=UPI00288371C9|nr:DMT family transporter [Endozoicomonas sp.]